MSGAGGPEALQAVERHGASGGHVVVFSRKAGTIKLRKNSGEMGRVDRFRAGLRLIGRCARYVLAALASVGVLISALWGAWWAAAGGVLLLFALLNLLPKRRTLWLAALGGALIFATTPFTFNRIEGEQARLRGIALEHGPSALSRVDRVQIWIGHGVMALSGCALTFCEAASEALRMHWPGTSDKAIVESAFPYEASPWIREMIAEHARAVAQGTASAVPEGWRLSWTGERYDILREGRALFALGGGRLYVNDRKAADGFVLEAQAIVPIRYARGAATPVFDLGWMRLTLDDTVFWALQEVEWLHPYVMTYRFSLRVDESGRIVETCDGSC